MQMSVFFFFFFWKFCNVLNTTKFNQKVLFIRCNYRNQTLLGVWIGLSMRNVVQYKNVRKIYNLKIWRKKKTTEQEIKLDTLTGIDFLIKENWWPPAKGGQEFLQEKKLEIIRMDGIVVKTTLILKCLRNGQDSLT